MHEGDTTTAADESSDTGRPCVIYVGSDREATDKAASALRERLETASVRIVATPSEALSVLDEQRGDCVISERTFQEEDGLAFLETVRDRHGNLPFVFYVENGDEKFASEAVSAGVTEYVPNRGDESFSKLVEAVDEALERRVAYRLTSTEADEIRTIVERIEDHAIFLLDPQGYVTSWNRGAERIKGYEQNEILGKHFSIFYPEEESSEEMLKRTRTLGHAETEGWRIRKDGSRFWAHVTLIPRYDDNGEIRGYAKFTRDKTDQRERERRLKQEHELTQRILDTVPMGVTVHTPDGNLVRANDTIRELLDIVDADLLVGAETEEVQLYGPDGDPIPPDDHPIRVVVETGEPVEGREIILERPGGDRTWLSVNSAPLINTDSSEIERVVTAAKDVTERKQREEELQSAREELEDRRKELEDLVDELAESNAELEQFAYAVSHDLKEPLRMVISYLDLLERRYGDQLDPTAEEFVEYAADGAERMQQMIEDLLAYSRIEQSEQTFEPVECDGVLEDVRKSFAHEDDLDLRAEDLPRVCGNRSQLMQLLQNLIANAVEHGATESEPVTVRVSAERAGERWRLSVSDDGPGIPPDQRERIFDLFNSVGESGGTGIGLAICNKVVERHGGRIWVESELGDGTTFHFTLPAVDADQ